MTDGGAPAATAPAPDRAAAERALLVAIVVSIALHALALAAMATLIRPGVDFATTPLERARFLAASPSLWRIGWLPWHLTAASDLAVSVALAVALRGRAGAGWARAGLVLTVPALVADQWGEVVMVTTLVDRARDLVALAGASAAPPVSALDGYVALEAWTLLITGTCANATYTLMTACWVLALAQRHGGVRANAAFVATAALDLALFAGCSATNWWATSRASAADGYPGANAMIAFNAVAFPLLCVVLGLAGLLVRRGLRERAVG